VVVREGANIKLGIWVWFIK